MFAAKLADARASADKIFGTNKPDCDCARAAAIDVIYDKSPAIAEVELADWAVTMSANLYYTDSIDEDAAEWIYSYYWCYNNTTRCGNDRN